MKKFAIVIGVCPGKGKPVWSLVTKATNLEQLRGAVEKKLQIRLRGSLWCPGPAKEITESADLCGSYKPHHLCWKLMVEVGDDEAVSRLNDCDMLVVEGSERPIVESWDPPKDDAITMWIVEEIPLFDRMNNDELETDAGVNGGKSATIPDHGLHAARQLRCHAARVAAIMKSAPRLTWAAPELMRYTAACGFSTRLRFFDFLVETQVDQSYCFFVAPTSERGLRLIDAATGDVEREVSLDDTKIKATPDGSFKPTGELADFDNATSGLRQYILQVLRQYNDKTRLRRADPQYRSTSEREVSRYDTKIIISRPGLCVDLTDNPCTLTS